MNNKPVFLNISKFGPIIIANLVFDKYTVLIGEQGSGKSTIAKTFSLFTWLEKALMRHTVTEKYLTQYSRFQKKYCAYYRLESYFKKDTYLNFEGLHYIFTYQNEELSIVPKVVEEDYKVAKVMYVPAERNFLSTVDNTSKLKDLPSSLQTFLEEFDQAKNDLKEGYKFPFNNVKFEYDSLNKISWVSGSDYRIRLSAASSGYQSVLPLVLVSKNLSDQVQNDTKRKGLDQQELNQINKEIEKIMSDSSLTEEVKFAMARSVSSRFKYSHFVNIVEELELNLYPESQKAVLYELLAHTNQIDLNRIVLTTHSPYIINYLTLAVKAWQLILIIPKDSELHKRIGNIVPDGALINPTALHVYELKDGKVHLLANCDGIPSDNNFLNNYLEETNDSFDQLLEIEEENEYEQ